MPIKPWPADDDTVALLEKVKQKYHHPRLEEATVAVVFNGSKAFVNGRFNWGKTQKVNEVHKLLQHKKCDFLLNLPGEAWVDILDNHQREAWLDLRLSCCQVEYVPVVDEKNKPIKDKWGRIQYTDEIKRDDDGEIKWKRIPLDLGVFQENVMHYGCWLADIQDLRSAIMTSEKKVSFEAKYGA